MSETRCDAWETTMIEVRRSNERGHGDHGWLDSRHTFSFADYHDPEFMGYGPLRVINEDRVQPGQGFGTHGHRDMEIISYVLEGALEHKDSMGNGSVLRPGFVQRMTAGTGVRHSEFNHSPAELVHFLQIWVIPDQAGLAPGYEEREFADAEKQGALRLIASRDGRDGSVVLHQDVDLYASLLEAGDELVHEARPGRKTWIQLVRGEIDVNGETLRAGDGAALVDEERIAIRGAASAELLLFDMG
jgi:redox-sensitive bicupin YhaK (pirin superfamily)